MDSWAQRRAALTLADLDGHEVKFNLEEEAVDARIEIIILTFKYSN